MVIHDTHDKPSFTTGNCSNCSVWGYFKSELNYFLSRAIKIKPLFYHFFERVMCSCGIYVWVHADEAPVAFRTRFCRTFVHASMRCRTLIKYNFINSISYDKSTTTGSPAVCSKKDNNNLIMIADLRPYTTVWRVILSFRHHQKSF